ncbi:hypothetical protein MUGA111182_10125 [Mucilaginibacter galii]|uniref:Uncharacterized protein n=1 Tax=Mucilaginibacter galii TaxID=2005073 RepID=A0A917JAQ7_9SPHI|nr:hypothetical protein [Mucilaginibacter galii]GGI51122.1 hypothetical protein GCM10011425_23340 [Mucilaginibacter galii]
MAKSYQISKEQIVTRPLAFLAPVGIVFIVMFLLMPVMVTLLSVEGNISNITASDMKGMVIVMPFILACIPFFTYSRRQIIFNAADHTIYRQTIFRRKPLLKFNEAGDIVLKIGMGQSYYLKALADRYGKGYRISSSFSGEKDKDKHEFEEVVLPAIRQMLALQPAANLVYNSKVLFEAGILNYYTEHPQGYILKPGGLLKLLPGLIILGLGACYGWYTVITNPGGDKALAVGTSVGFVFMVFAFTKRLIFDTSARQVIVYYLGLPISRYALANFAGFNIVRKTYNGLYSGTDVRLKFQKPSSHSTTDVTLADFNKTNPIEPFIAETEYVLSKAGSGSAKL